MLTVIIGGDSEARTNKREDILKQHSAEVVALDDMMSSISELEQYLYPSLFSVVVPVIHGKYLLEEYAEQLTKELLQKLVISQTVFILEERALAAAFIKTIEKEGGTVFHDKGSKQVARPNTIFGVTAAITATSKKDRWLAYRAARSEHAPEALIGILYWKLRDLIEKSGARGAAYKMIYTKLMKAHKRAWQKGFVLDVAIEKVVLESQ